MPVYTITMPNGSTNNIEADAAFIEANYPGAVEVVSGPPPEPPAPQPPARIITRLAFRNRFTAAEKVALDLASLDDAEAPPAQRQQAALLRVYLKDLDAATFVDLDLAETRGGVQMLQAAGLLAPGRAAEILDAPVQAHEAYAP